MLLRSEKTVIGIIESKHGHMLSHGELEAMVLREEISDIKITFTYPKDANGNLSGTIQATYDVGIKKGK
jgi:hypothetical protein